MLYKHDAAWIKSAKNGKLNDYEFRKILINYGLVRGATGKAMFAGEKNIEREKFLRYTKNICRKIKPEVVLDESLNVLWHKLRDYINMHLQSHIIHPTIDSAASKIIWFFYPEYWVMYDNLNRRGLARWAKRQKLVKRESDVNPDLFIHLMREFWNNEAVCRVQAASQSSAEKYPYLPRVAEKYLWLEGLNDTDKIDKLSKFNDALQYLSNR